MVAGGVAGVVAGGVSASARTGSPAWTADSWVAAAAALRSTAPPRGVVSCGGCTGTGPVISHPRRARRGSRGVHVHEFLGELEIGHGMPGWQRTHDFRRYDDQQFRVGLLQVARAKQSSEERNVAQPWNFAQLLGDAIIRQYRRWQSFARIPARSESARGAWRGRES